MKKTEIFYPETSNEWREWLIKNHHSKPSVWLVFHTKSSQKPTITWSEAVDEALCFGWIDSKKIRIDNDTAHQFFSKRKAKSTWSKINKEKVRKLISSGLMTKAGYESIETARKNGSWRILDDIEALVIPEDLEAAFRKHNGSKEHFLNLSKTVKKLMLYRIKIAKRPETRKKRIDEITDIAGQNKKTQKP